MIAVACSIFFSGVEAAFSSMDRVRLRFFSRHVASFRSSMLVGNYVSLVVCGILVAVLLEQCIPAAVVPHPFFLLLLQVLVGWLVFVLFGELLPRGLFKINPDLTLRVLALPIFLSYAVLWPVSRCLVGCARLLFWLTGMKINRESTDRAIGKVDLDQYVQKSLEEAAEENALDDDVKIFQNALDFSNIRIRDCMVPRTEVVAVDVTTELEELKNLFVESGLSKIIVYDGNIDNVIGYIHSSEMFRHPADWRNSVKPVPIVPETMPAHRLMKLFMQQKKTIAVVVDEFGGTSGMVTLEDLVEEIFGEIEDEHDVKMHVAKKIADDEYVLSGRLEIDTLNEMFDLNLPESDEYVTVAGMILHYYEDFPKPNETVVCGIYSFKIIRATATKIELVRMKVLETDGK